MDDITPTLPVGARENLSALANQIQEFLAHTTPEGMALQQRDHFMRMWDDVMQQVLKNMQSIRDDNTAIRRRLDDGARAGAEETRSLLAAFHESNEQILAALNAINEKVGIEPRKPWWKP